MFRRTGSRRFRRGLQLSHLSLKSMVMVRSLHVKARLGPSPTEHVNAPLVSFRQLNSDFKSSFFSAHCQENRCFLGEMSNQVFIAVVGTIA